MYIVYVDFPKGRKLYHYACNASKITDIPSSIRIPSGIYGNKITYTNVAVRNKFWVSERNIPENVTKIIMLKDNGYGEVRSLPKALAPLPLLESAKRATTSKPKAHKSLIKSLKVFFKKRGGRVTK